uniref:Uncharacterized protein n=1 Tax=viral metagenome TaxID=1070528 RepID=A0A6H1ZPS8_9ZZZZ
MLVTKGLVYRVEFQFPAGCAGLAGIIVADGGFQVWPSTLGNWFATDNHVVAFDDMYTKFAEPFQLDFWGYNLDETYAHTIYVRIGMADKEIFQARFLPNVAYEMINRELEKVEAVKEEERQALIASPFPWLRGKE